MITNSIKALDKERQKILSKMYVSNVKNRLREMDTPPETDCKRWIWELMQNAKDSISGSDRKEVDVKLEIKDNEVIFQHDGCPFNGKTYLALLYKYSEGKSQSAESTGRFGTGFLTTHCLSKTVNIDGPIENIEDGQKEKVIRFNVTMYRDGKTDQELISALERMENEKKFFHDESTKWTKYTYSLKTDINKKASKLGLENFKLNIIKTMLFNSKFKNAELKTESDTLTIKDESEDVDILDKVQIKKYSVYNEEKKIYTVRFIYIKIEKTSEKLTSRFNSQRELHLEACIEINENNEIIFKEASPCLFCSLPLVGSEKHILPITLNTNDFEPSSLTPDLRDSNRLYNHIITKTRSVAKARFEALGQGENFHSLDASLKENTYTDVSRTQNTIYLRLSYNKPSGTVLNVRKSMWIHPTINRAVSIREAARLQTFPDSFVFCGPKDSQYQQVGNAVPPMFARAIAEHLAGYLEKKKDG